jgi:CRISPR-associated endonuclease Csn1
MHNDTAYGLLENDRVYVHKVVDGQRIREESKLKVITFTSSNPRHGQLANGEPRPYKGYKGDSNYCIEIIRNDSGKWEGEVISTFEAYQIVRQGGIARLRHTTLSCSGKPLVMRLVRNDIVRLVHEGTIQTLRLCTVRGNGTLALAAPSEANVDARTRANDLSYVFKTAGSLQKSKGRLVGISPIGGLRDPGFSG